MIVVGCGRTCCCDAPQNNVGREPFCSWDFLEDDAFATKFRKLLGFKE